MKKSNKKRPIITHTQHTTIITSVEGCCVMDGVCFL